MTDLDKLVEFWCDRRAFKPLREVLTVYPIAMGLTDEIGNLYDCLRKIERVQGRDLPKKELEMLSKIVDELHESLYR